jgi:SAM-dependent methyltransferase
VTVTEFSNATADPGWDDAASERWLAQLDVREAPLAPVLDALFDRADLQRGETVLDVGCGAGPSTLEAARRVSPGRVTGVDFSSGLIEAARSRAADLPIDWMVADAQTAEFARAAYDVVISRFGVMFFTDPERAFANLAGACRPDGRLVVAVWPIRGRSAFFARPLDVLSLTFQRLGIKARLPPDDRGPFALGDRDRTTRMLRAAGWVDVDISSDERPLYLGGPGATDEQAAHFCLSFGPVNIMLADQPEDVREAVRRDLLAALPDWRDDVGIGLPGGVMLVSARRGAGAVSLLSRRDRP